MENTSPQYAAKIRCPKCNTKIGVKANALGKTISCPACKAAVPVPPAEGQTQTPPEVHLAANVPPGSDKETIKYTCPKCSGKLENPGTMGGRDDACPLCGFVHPVPLSKGQQKELERRKDLEAETAKADATRLQREEKERARRERETEAKELNPPPQNSDVATASLFRRIPKAGYIGGAAIVLAGIVSIVFALIPSKSESNRLKPQEDKSTINIKAQIKGGAWLTKQAGNSETLRGLNIEILKSKIHNERVITLLETKLAAANKKLNSAKEAVEEHLNKIKELTAEAKNMPSVYTPFYESIMSGIKWRREELKKLEKSIPELKFSTLNLENAIQEVTKIAPSDLIDAAILPKLSPQKGALDTEVKAWNDILNQQTIGSTHTDVDGKYQIELPGGDYYLYAIFESSLGHVSWFLPIKIVKEGEIKLDLHNENADVIENKSE